MARTYKGKQIVMESFRAHGVEYIFGNPGTTELPIIDSLLDYPDIHYILALHEAVALSAADAYALLTGKVGVVNVHVAPGLGNALGMLYNAKEGRSPLLVTAGQQDSRMRLREPVLFDDLAALARPLTKWSVQAEHADELPAILHRAFKIAQDPPRGPVFVALPINVMDQETAQPPLGPSPLYQRSLPDPAGVAELARLLLGARRPVIVCGDGVGRGRAVAELVALAETLGAEVWSEVLTALHDFPNGHALYRGGIAGDQSAIRRSLGAADAVLLVGGEFFEEVWFEPGSPFPDEAVVLQLGASPRELAHNYPVRCGLLADLAQGLRAVREAVAAGADAAYRSAAAARNAAAVNTRNTERARQRSRAEKTWDTLPMSPARLMAELKPLLPADVVMVHEAITAAPDLTRTIDFDSPDGYVAGRGGGIGQALPSAIGAQVAHPKRPVVAISGDGSSLYTIQGLWSAARHNLPIVFIILHNRTYRILKLNMNRYRQGVGQSGERGYPFLDLDEPPVDYVSVARGFGLQARRIENPAEIAPAFSEALAARRPWLLEVILEGGV
ncbi:MAG: thiamine pyrophosphate-binding protein [Candidatus Lambdaproteobacteria bacterium]|nr:thiamine pyrophosphate-binding protein [Candidatus Lambdaproteobacteria bacterium]